MGLECLELALCFKPRVSLKRRRVSDDAETRDPLTLRLRASPPSTTLPQTSPCTSHPFNEQLLYSFLLISFLLCLIAVYFGVRTIGSVLEDSTHRSLASQALHPRCITPAFKVL